MGTVVAGLRLPHTRQPIAGDVIIFHPVEGVGNKSIFGDDVFIKRVVAVEGDTVEVRALRGLCLEERGRQGGCRRGPLPG